MQDNNEAGASPAPAEGWGWPGLAAKPHYFVGPESLCGRWWFNGELTPDTGTVSAKDCVTCGRKLEKLRPAATS